MVQFLNLPVFLTIKENVIENLFNELENTFNSIREHKIIFFTSRGLNERFKDKLELIKNDTNNLFIYYVDDSSYDIAVDIAKKIAIEDFDYVIGFGGGTILDTAKYAAYVSKKVYISIPTTLSNDGLASPIAVLKTSQGKRKSFGCKSPDGIIIDLEIIKSSPDFLLMAGLGDTLSNFTSLFDWELESKIMDKKINDFAYLLSDTALNMLLYSEENNIKSESFIRRLAQSLVLSGLAMDIAGNSRPCSGSEHLFSHALDEYYNIIDVPHGMKVALGSVASCIFQNRSPVILLDFLKRYKINVSPKSINISKDIFIDAWIKAQSTRPERYTILNTIELSDGYLEEVYYRIMEELK